MRRKTKQKQKKDYDRALFWLSRFTLIRFWAEPIHGHDHILLCSCTGKTTNWSPKATAAAVLKMPCPQSRAQMFMSSSNQSRQTCTLPQTKFHDQRSSRNPSRHQRSWSVRHRTYFISSALKLFDLKEKIQNTVRTHQLEAPQSSSQIQTHGCIIMVFKIWNDQECSVSLTASAAIILWRERRAQLLLVLTSRLVIIWRILCSTWSLFGKVDDWFSSPGG